ncbi:unnamed protein product, partial [Owenia fusiformis]
LQKEPCSLSYVEGRAILYDEELRENKADATTGEEYETNNTVQAQGVESDGARGFSFSSRRSSSSSSDDGNVECHACTEVDGRPPGGVCNITMSALQKIHSYEGVYRYGINVGNMRYTIYLKSSDNKTTRSKIEQDFPNHNFFFEIIGKDTRGVQIA